MPLEKEQVLNIKKQILQQIDSWQTSDEKKQQAKKQIQAMNSKQLEEFLAKNNLIKQPGQQSQQAKQCPFCLISTGQIKAYKIAENSHSVAVLEINPLSKGHTLIVSKKHLPIEKVHLSFFQLAQQLVSLIKEKLKPKQVQLTTSMQEHAVLNIIPLTGKETKREKASEEELKQIQKQLLKRPKAKKKQERSGKKREKLQEVPERIP